MLDLLRQLCGITDADPPQVITPKLHQQLLVAGLDPTETAPTLLHLLGITAGTEQVTMLSPEEHRARTFAILRQFSLQRSQRQPQQVAISTPLRGWALAAEGQGNVPGGGARLAKGSGWTGKGKSGERHLSLGPAAGSCGRRGA